MDADAFALGSNHAWLWTGQSIYSTADSGKPWHGLARFTFYGVPELQFVSRTRGYLLNPRPPGNKGLPYLFETTDAGRTWLKVTTYPSSWVG